MSAIFTKQNNKAKHQNKFNANVKDGLRDQDTDKMSELRLFGMDLADHNKRVRGELNIFTEPLGIPNTK